MIICRQVELRVDVRACVRVCVMCDFVVWWSVWREAVAFEGASKKKTGRKNKVMAAYNVSKVYGRLITSGCLSVKENVF